MCTYSDFQKRFPPRYIETCYSIENYAIPALAVEPTQSVNFRGLPLNDSAKRLHVEYR